MALSQSDLYSLAIAQGLTPERAKIASAVGMAESDGDPNAHNDNVATGDDSWGVWQINMLGAMGPERLKQFGISRKEELLNPQTNARAMAILSNKGAKWSDWSTYNSGAYGKYMHAAVADQSKDPGWLSKLGDVMAWPIGGMPGLSSIKDTASAAAAVTEMLAKMALWGSNPRNWVRVAYVAGGTVVVIAGLVMVVDSTKTGGALMKGATQVAKAAATKKAPSKTTSPGGAGKVT